ncbi:MAG TPA: 5-oxoprolinase subunit PxpB [Candidatus Limnocylindria bacterium]|nr:5-oxoprolinase subunit PxpB [Candidatus Limnocylindria bacterium]
MTVRAFGDRAFLIEIEQRIDPSIVDAARAIADTWERRGLGEAIPAYASVVVTFDPARTAWKDAADAARALAAEPPARPAPVEGRLIEVPTIYDGPDLADTAARSGLSPSELVSLHSGREYRALFLGFMPGLAYCGTVDPRIVAPRLTSPRQRVPKGTVAVATGQTLVYPVDSPGGWRLIGRTDLAVFDPSHEPAALIRAGDRLRFVPR